MGTAGPAAQWKYGCLVDEVRDEAIRVIDSGTASARWTGVHAVRRQQMLEKLRAQLQSEQPARRRPRRRVLPVIASVEARSPDGSARAVSCALARHPHPQVPRMQLVLDIVTDGQQGGGGVPTASCEYDEVSLLWLDNTTLQIGYPASARLSDMPATHYFAGRTIHIAYQAKEGTG